MDITYYISTLQIIDLSSQYAFHVLHTPGHTPESVVYLLIDKTKGNKPLKVLAVHFKDIILYRWGGGNCIQGFFLKVLLICTSVYSKSRSPKVT